MKFINSVSPNFWEQKLEEVNSPEHLAAVEKFVHAANKMEKNMEILSKDSVTEIQRMLLDVFGTPIDNGLNPHTVKPAWIIVPVSAYVPGAKSRYDFRNEVLEPIYLRNIGDVELVPQILKARAACLSPDQELGVNATILIGWSNGVVGQRELQFYDGHPFLTEIPKAALEDFNFLKTNNSYHLYAKRPVHIDHSYNMAMVDREWLRFKDIGAGYIRVTQQTKGPIVRNVKP